MLSLLSLVVDVELSSASQAFPDGIRWAFCSGPVVGTGLFLRRVFICFCRHLFPLHCSDSSSYSAVLCLHISLSCLASHLSLLFVTPWYDIVVSSHRHQLFCCSSFSLSIIATIVLCPIAHVFINLTWCILTISLLRTWIVWVRVGWSVLVLLSHVLSIWLALAMYRLEL